MDPVFGPQHAGVTAENHTDHHNGEDNGTQAGKD
jgi:hypothetical protein